MLLAFGLSSDALAMQCPSESFADFAKAFSAKPDIRHAFTASPVQKLKVAVDGNRPRVMHQNLPVLDAGELNVLSTKSGLALQVMLPNKLIARDPAGTILKIFTFKRSDCWVLSGVEDWSLEEVLDAQAQTIELPPKERALRRGAMFDDLGNQAHSDSSAQLYEAALNSYLDGAQKGSAQAAFAAASISLSGQAPELATSEIFELLIIASKEVPDAGIALAEFYCDEGKYDQSRFCINPGKSLDALEGAARLGSADALVKLGDSYETGRLVAKNLPRAMACYLKAVNSDHESGRRGVTRLYTQGVVANNSILCL